MVTLIVSIFFFAPAALSATSPDSPAHDLDYALASVELSADGTYQISVAFHIAAYVLEEEPGNLSLESWARLQSMSDRELGALVERARDAFARRLTLRFDGKDVEPRAVIFPSVKMIRADGLALNPLRAPAVVIRGAAPHGLRHLSAAFPYDIGPVLLRIGSGGETIDGQLVSAGQESLPLTLSLTPSDDANGASRWSAALRYFALGFVHILPSGLDHILFVLGLFLLSTRLRPLAWQVTAFTLAHSVTLALSVYGVVSLPRTIVEPLIALSIAVIAAENMITTRLHPWRPVVVFVFGLVHGLGFASALQALDLPTAKTVAALAGFNLGVEAGQLGVILLALTATAWWRSRSWYRVRIVIPASCGIALVGLFWAIQRVGFGG